MFSSFKLLGQSRTELNTELRFIFASARVDGVELLRLDLPVLEIEKDDARINGCLIKVLRTLKKENVIEFYVNKDSFAANSTEAIFLLNKYGEYIDVDSIDRTSVYVKL